jgi:branched-chain amino acid transport system ATP-binding protein
LDERSAPSLEVIGLRAGYDNRDVLESVGLSVRAGEFVGLVGHNGAGKTTLLKTLAGALPVRQGEIALGGRSIVNASIPQRIGLGLAYVPQGNPVFPHLTVRDNLRARLLGAREAASATSSLEEALASFPRLKERETQLAGSLSGGEKQMLSLAAALLSKPHLLLLDEPSLGLAPAMVASMLAMLRKLVKETGAGILMVEQKAREALRVCDRLVILKQGRVVFTGPCSEDAAEESEFRELCL